MYFNQFVRQSAGLLLISVLAVGCATGPATYKQKVQSSVSEGIIHVNERGDGTVILHGWVEDYYARQRAEHVASQGEGVTQVINRIHVIN